MDNEVANSELLQSINPQLRPAIEADLPAVKQLHRKAWPTEEGERIVQVVENLWQTSTGAPHPTRHWVITDKDEAILGHVCSSGITTAHEGGVGWILAPLAVAPEHQGFGYGSALVRHAINHALTSDQQRIVVYGDPAYYGCFGFDNQAAIAFKPPYPLAHPMGWQGIVANREILQCPADVRCHKALMQAELW